MTHRVVTIPVASPSLSSSVAMGQWSAGAVRHCLAVIPWCQRAYLSPVHTSNNVEAAFDFVEDTFDFVAKNGNNVE